MITQGFYDFPKTHLHFLFINIHTGTNITTIIHDINRLHTIDSLTTSVSIPRSLENAQLLFVLRARVNTLLSMNSHRTKTK